MYYKCIINAYRVNIKIITLSKIKLNYVLNTPQPSINKFQISRIIVKYSRFPRFFSWKNLYFQICLGIPEAVLTLPPRSDERDAIASGEQWRSLDKTFINADNGTERQRRPRHTMSNGGGGGNVGDGARR